VYGRNANDGCYGAFLLELKHIMEEVTYNVLITGTLADDLFLTMDCCTYYVDPKPIERQPAPSAGIPIGRSSMKNHAN
jgi:hypothetical protein